jgi:hypothetical protein
VTPVGGPPSQPLLEIPHQDWAWKWTGLYACPYHLFGGLPSAPPSYWVGQIDQTGRSGDVKQGPIQAVNGARVLLVSLGLQLCGAWGGTESAAP